MLHVFYKGNAAINQAFEMTGEWQLEEVRLHLSAVGGAAENFTITVDSAKGEEYDIVLSTTAMAGSANVQYKPTRPDTFGPGDALSFAYANTNTQTWGLEIIYSRIR